MSLNSEITRLENAKEDIKDAIEEMGGEVGEGTIDTYATAVRSIPTGVETETDPVFTNSPAYGITSNDITSWNGKSTFSGNYNDLSNKPDIKNALIVTYDETNNVASHTPQEIKNAMDSGRDVYFKQDGNGEIFFAPVLDASATLGKCYIVKDGYNTIVPALYSITIDSQKSVSSNYQLLQEKLVSGTNIKTINNTSILGSGNIDISGGPNYTAGTGIDITNNEISCTIPSISNSLNDYVYIGIFPGSSQGLSNLSGSSYYKWILDEAFSANANGKFVVLINKDAYSEDIGDMTNCFTRTIYICKSAIGSERSSLVFECIYQIPGVSNTSAKFSQLVYNKETATVTKNANGYTITTSNMGYARAGFLSTYYTGNNVFIPTNNNHPANKKYVDDTLLNIAPLYSSSSTYSVGDYVIYNNILYVCNTAISSAEDWTSAHWTQTTVAEIIKNL